MEKCSCVLQRCFRSPVKENKLSGVIIIRRRRRWRWWKVWKIQDTSRCWSFFNGTLVGCGATTPQKQPTWFYWFQKIYYMETSWSCRGRSYRCQRVGKKLEILTGRSTTLTTSTRPPAGSTPGTGTSRYWGGNLRLPHHLNHAVQNLISGDTTESDTIMVHKTPDRYLAVQLNLILFTLLSHNTESAMRPFWVIRQLFNIWQYYWNFDKIISVHKPAIWYLMMVLNLLRYDSDS